MRVSTIKKEQIIVVIIVESLDTEQLIVDTNLRQMWQKFRIKIRVSTMKILKIYFWQVIHFQKKKKFGIFTLDVVIICVKKERYFLL